MSKKYYTNPDYIKRTVAGTSLLVPTGEATQEFNGMVNMNETGEFMWDYLKEPRTVEELAQALLDEYEVEKEMALVDAVVYIKGGLERHMILEIEE